jgi:spore germination protein YaaH
MPRRLICVAAALLVCSCSLPDFTVPPNYGFVTVTSGGRLLIAGSDDALPTLGLRIHAGAALRSQDVRTTLDGRVLQLGFTGGDITASVKPLALGSSHRLAVAVAGRSTLGIDFSVIAPTAAMLAAHIDPTAGLVVDGAFAGAPSQTAVAAALPGAQPAWVDPTHVRLTWPAAPPAAIDLPATIPTDRGSHLAAPVHLDLGQLRRGTLHRVTVPAAAPPGAVPVTAFVVDTSASNTSLAAHLNHIRAVSPTGWQVHADGSVQGSPDPVAVDRAQAAGAQVWPSLANDASDPASTTALLHGPAAISRLIDQVVSAQAAAGYHGINLDFEGMAATDKNAFTAFVTALAAALHQHGAQLTVDVVPHDGSGVNQYSAAYDVPAIAAATDLVDLMAYDQHADGTAPGPVAGLDWDRSQLAATLPELNPAHTLLGIPLYGRRWQGGAGSAVSYAEATSGALSAAGARVDYDFSAETPFIVSADGATVTYFDDADSLARKIALVSAHGMAGVAAWRLGFEDTGFWSIAG